MKGLMGIILALFVGATVHIAAWKLLGRPLVPWRTQVIDIGPWWHMPASWLAVILLVVAGVAFVSLIIRALNDGHDKTGAGFWLSLWLVVGPYLFSVLLYAAISGAPTPAITAGSAVTEVSAGTVVARDATVPARTSGPAMELKISSVADADAGLARVRDHLRTTLTPAITRLTKDVEDVKSRLKSNGIAGSADLKGNARGRLLAQELAEAIRYRNAVAMSIEKHENAAFELDSLLRRLKRAELVASAGLPDGDFLRMNATLRLLDGQLAERAGQPKELSAIELDALIDRELAPKGPAAADSPASVAATAR